MKSTEVYREARLILAPWCKEAGFKRTRGGMLGWYRPVGYDNFVFWLQCSQDGWDQYAGSKFCVELQFGPSRMLGGGGVSNRLGGFLTDEELESVCQIQNGVISRLPKPLPSHWTFGSASSVALRYREEFRPISRPYGRGHGMWLRYHQPQDVRLWASLLLEVLPRINRCVESSSSPREFIQRGLD